MTSFKEKNITNGETYQTTSTISCEWRLFTCHDFKNFKLGDINVIRNNFKSFDPDISKVKSSLIADQNTVDDEYQKNKLSGKILATANQYKIAIKQLAYHLFRESGRSEFEHGESKGKKSKVPRTHKWRSYRITEHNSLLGLLTLKNSEAFNLCEVDVFLATEICELENGSVTEAMLLFILSDAVKCGGSLAIQFTSNGFNKQLPETICQVAKKHNIELKYLHTGMIAPDESRKLYLKLTPFSRISQKRIEEYSALGIFSIERVCYLVNHGIWTAEEMSGIIRCAQYPETIVNNHYIPEDGHLYTHGMFHGQAALLGDYLQKRLCKKINNDNTGNHLEYNSPDLFIGVDFIEQLLARVYYTPEPFHLDDWRPPGHECVFESEQLVVLLRPYKIKMMRAMLIKDIQRANEAQKKYQGDAIFAVLVPYDYYLLNDDFRAKLVGMENKVKVKILVCPLKSTTLQDEVTRRISQGEFVRS